MNTLFLVLSWMGCAASLEYPNIIAPDRVPPVGEFSIEVESVDGATLEYWWSVDGTPYPNFTGPTVVQKVPTEGDEWTVIVRQSLKGAVSPPSRAIIPIVDEVDFDTESLDSGDTGLDSGTPVYPGCAVGSSEECTATDCAQILSETDNPQNGLFWFEGSGEVLKPYKARCDFDGDRAWMRVMSVSNSGPLTWYKNDPIWTVGCGELPDGLDSNALTEWVVGEEFGDPGVNPGACTVPVEQIRMCPHSSVAEHPCYESPMVLSPSDTLHDGWTSGSDGLSFSASGAVGPSFDNDDFMSVCAGAVAEGGPAPSAILTWEVGDRSPRVGFTISVGFFELIYGVGFRSGIGINAGFHQLEADEGCGGAVSVWVR